MFNDEASADPVGFSAVESLHDSVRIKKSTKTEGKEKTSTGPQRSSAALLSVVQLNIL